MSLREAIANKEKAEYELRIVEAVYRTAIESMPFNIRVVISKEMEKNAKGSDYIINKYRNTILDAAIGSVLELYTAGENLSHDRAIELAEKKLQALKEGK